MNLIQIKSNLNIILRTSRYDFHNIDGGHLENYSYTIKYKYYTTKIKYIFITLINHMFYQFQ